MREWLTNALMASAETVPEEAEGFVLMRGLPYRLMVEMGVGVWVPPDEHAPCASWPTKRNGRRGEKMEGWLSIPLWSPRGRVVGSVFRRWDGEKEVNNYFLPESKWVPVFAGLTPTSLRRIWEGGDVWLVEGVFDLALGHVTPPRDVVLSTEGAKITAPQVAFLQRFVSPRAMVHVAFDEDETGRKMRDGYTHPDTGRRVWGVVERLERAGVRARPVRYHGGKDPSKIWEDGGTFALEAAFNL